MTPRVVVPLEAIEAFCARWAITELALFGSVLRDDFGPDSDVDVLVTFAAGARWSGYEVVDMVAELKAIFGREVDFVEKPAIRNPFRRREILRTAQVLYAA
jgi:uncharacterized protein